MIKAMSRVLLSAALLAFLSGSSLAQQAKPEHPGGTEHPKAEQGKHEHSKTEQAKPEHHKGEEKKSEHQKSEHQMSEHPKSEHPK